MPVLRNCPSCRRVNRVGAEHLADSGRCGACKAELPPLDEPLPVDERLFDEILEGARVPVLVDFWAEWCGPCRAVAPEVAQTAQLTAGRAIVMKVDTERYPSLAARYQVRGIPTFAVFQAGKLVRQEVGARGHAEMEAWLEAARSAF